ncbi:MAG: ATP synthase F1 subunit epsilon [Bacteroidia bacterium]|nr:ATP synthase F1 subunit epsilon [Bacteroidota bacterium]MCZ2129344.1 ATP synthase F1 subunit epsilon [Bacteroidia bacterium]
MLEIKIITPDTTLFEGNADSIILPGAKGSFQVLKGHAPVVSNLVKGNVEVGNGTKNESFAVEGGIVEVLNNKVIVLV